MPLMEPQQATRLPANYQPPLIPASAIPRGEAEAAERAGEEFVDPTDFDGGRYVDVTTASTNVGGFQYDAKAKTLFVRFQPDPRTGFVREGTFSGVELVDYIELRESLSFGSHIQRRMRGVFAWTPGNY